MKSILNITEFKRTNRQATFSIYAKLALHSLMVKHCSLLDLSLSEFVLPHYSNSQGLVCSCKDEGKGCLHRYLRGSLLHRKKGPASEKISSGLLVGEDIFFCFLLRLFCFIVFTLIWAVF